MFLALLAFAGYRIIGERKSLADALTSQAQILSPGEWHDFLAGTLTAAITLFAATVAIIAFAQRPRVNVQGSRSLAARAMTAATIHTVARVSAAPLSAFSSATILSAIGLVPRLPARGAEALCVITAALITSFLAVIDLYAKDIDRIISELNEWGASAERELRPARERLVEHLLPHLPDNIEGRPPIATLYDLTKPLGDWNAPEKLARQIEEHNSLRELRLVEAKEALKRAQDELPFVHETIRALPQWSIATVSAAAVIAPLLLFYMPSTTGLALAAGLLTYGSLVWTGIAFLAILRANVAIMLCPPSNEPWIKAHHD